MFKKGGRRAIALLAFILSFNAYGVDPRSYMPVKVTSQDTATDADVTTTGGKNRLEVSSATKDGSGNSISSTSGALNVNVTNSFAAGIADRTSFTYGTSIQNAIGGVYQDTAPSVTAGQGAAVRITQFRALHLNLRDSSGNEIGVSGNPLLTSRSWTLSSGTDSIAAVQSGAWTTGRTWTTASGTDSISAVQSGTWTVQQGTPPWSVVGNVASGASDSGNPVKIGGPFNTTQPTVTNGQRVDAQMTSRGAQIIATGVDALNVNNVTGTVSLPTGAATSALQTAGNATLTAIDAGIPAALGQTTMANSMPVTIASNQSTVNVSTRGNNPAGTETVFPTAGIDTGNSTNVALGSNASFTGTWKDVSSYSDMTVGLIADQVSATNGLVIEYSMDGVTVDDNDTFTIPASNGQQYSFPLPWQYFRVRYTNGAVAQGSFRLSTKLHVTRPKPSSHKIGDNVSTESDAELVKAGVALQSGTSMVNVNIGQQTSANSVPVVIPSDQTVNVGGVYNTSPPSLTSGNSSVLQLDRFGGQLVSFGANFVNITTQTTTVVKNSPGYLFAICSNNVINNAAAVVYNNTAGSGTLFGTLTQQIQGSLLSGFAMWTPGCAQYGGVYFSTGITVVTNGATSNWTVIYK